MTSVGRVSTHHEYRVVGAGPCEHRIVEAEVVDVEVFEDVAP